MSEFFFPDPETGDFEQGLVAVGGELSVDILVEAYSKGIFPWPQEGYPMLWFCPDRRGVLHFKDFKIPQRLQRDLKKYSSLRISRNEAFQEVIQACSQQTRKGQSGTWISDDMIQVYTKMFEAGFSRSWEVWEGPNLVGGGYGVEVNGVFAGESLFHRKTNMSKLALIRMVEDLQMEGHEWMDTQMVTPLLSSFGAKEVSKKEFLRLLKKRQQIIGRK